MRRAVLSLILACVFPRPAMASPVLTEQLVIAYDHGSFSLAGQQPIRMVMPASDPLPEDLCGFWYELRDATGKLRYRGVLENPLRIDFGGQPVPTEDDPGSELYAPSRSFTLLVPKVHTGDSLFIFSSPMHAGGNLELAEQCARLDLTESP